MTAAQNPSPHSDQPEQPDLFAGVTGFEAYSATPPPEAPRADEPLPPPPEEPPAYDTIPPDPEAAAGILDYPVPAVWDDSSAHQTWASSEGSADDLIADLNPQQRAAVEHSGSPLLIVAGAGSGKTAVLTRRIAYLLRMRGVAPGQILAITFTNKAAAEMRDRVIDLVGPTATRMWVATFHSACVRILREQAHLLPGLNTNFTIYDADDSKRLLGMIAKDLQINAQKFPPRLLAAAISALKTELTDPDAASDEAAATRNPFDRTIAEVYTEYQRRLRAANALECGCLPPTPKSPPTIENVFVTFLLMSTKTPTMPNTFSSPRLSASDLMPANSAWLATPTNPSMRSAAPPFAISKNSNATILKHAQSCWSKTIVPPKTSSPRPMP